MAMDEANDFLLKWIILDKKPISARLYGRIRRVHVTQARDELKSFYESKNGKDAFATYFVTGRPRPDETQTMTQSSMDVDEEEEVAGGGSQPGPSAGRGSQTSIPERSEMMLVGQDKLQETRERLDQVFTEQLYALSPPLPKPATEASKVATMSCLSTIAQDLRSHKDLVQTWEETGRGVELGVIANDEIKDAGPSKTFVPNGKVGSAGSGQKIAPAPAKATATVKTEPITRPSANVTASSNVSKTAADKTKKGSGLDWSKAKKEEPPKAVEKKAAAKRKGAKSEEDDEDEDEGELDAGPIGYKDEDEEMGDAKLVGDVAPEQGGATRKRADAGDKADEERKRREAKKKELMDMMDEDDDEAGAKDPPVTTSETSTTNMMKGTEEAKETTKTSKAKTSASRKSKTSETTEKPVKRRVRKRREVVVGKERVKNEKGYWTNKDVMGYESYSSDESDSPTSEIKEAEPAKRSKESQKAPSKSTKANEKSPSPVSAQAPAPAQNSAPPTKNARSAASSAASSPAPSAPAKSGTAGKKVGGQSKLSSFFGKPKA